MAKQRIIGQVMDLGTTVVKSADTLIYETTQTIEFGSRTITNVMEELHNDSIGDLIDSRTNVALKLKEKTAELKEVGYTDEDIASMLNMNRRNR